MKTSEFKKLIREEVKKTLNEAAIKFPKDFYITHLDGKRYTLEYSKFGMEPTIVEAEQIQAQLRKTFAKISNTIQANPLESQATIYVRNEDVTIGIEFTSKLGFNQMDQLVVNGINSRD